MRHDIKGCVFSTLNTDAGCTSEEVDQLLERPEVKQGFIDSIPVNCGECVSDKVIVQTMDLLFFRKKKQS